MPGFDLHTHSDRSDGTLPPEQVAALAVERGLSGIALTDHDTTAGLERARAAADGRVEVLAGCELSAEHDGNPVHVLAIGFDPEEPEFDRVRTAIRAERVERARRMVDRLAELGAEIRFERVLELAGLGGPGDTLERRLALAGEGAAVGRPHVAAAMVEAGLVADTDEAFSLDWIGTGGRAYVPKRAVTPVRAVELIRVAHGVAVLAHPSVHAGARAVPEPLIRSMAAAGLAGLEVDHPDQDAGERAHWRALAAELDLAVTGGSDDHGDRSGYRLGMETTPDEAVRALLARAS
jgi:predicted metal-dependent phosphoesterase TrpH